MAIKPIIYPKDPISTWEDFNDWVSQYLSIDERMTHKWIFRGMGCSIWDLKSSIERAAESFEINFNELNQHEASIIREFRRRAHHYVTDLPHEDDLIEWLALMQHNGAPTRIIDWAYSPFVAAFFALEKAKADKNSAIWVVDYSPCSANSIYNKLSRNSKLAEDLEIRVAGYKESRAIHDSSHGDKHRQAAIISYFLENPKLDVVAVNPFRLNERLSIQQGVFLFPCDLSKPFMANIEESNSSISLKKVELSSNLDFRKLMISNLHRMNINSTTLFPGLGGYAESQKMLFALEDILKID